MYRDIGKCNNNEREMLNMAVFCKPINMAFRVDEKKTSDFLGQHASKNQNRIMIERAKKLKRHLDDNTKNIKW